MPSEMYKAVLDSLDWQLTLPEDDFETAKAKMEAVHGHPIDANTTAHWTKYGGVPCAVVSAQGISKPEQYLLYFRGGAFIAAGGSGFVFYAEMLSHQFDCTVVMADYRMVPESKFPGPLEDCCNAYLGMLDSGIAASAISFIGDSCGGGLVLTALLKLRDDGQAMPACGISLCGWFDLATNSEARDPLYYQAYTYKRGLDYADGESLTNPLISPIFASFEGLPPLLLQAGGIDPTSKGAEIVCEKARAVGIDVLLDISPEMVHGFHGLCNLGVDEAQQALSRAADFMNKHSS